MVNKNYRPTGILEYLVHISSGMVIAASPYMRIDTYRYRNRKLSTKGLKWLVNPNIIKETVKIPGGYIKPNSSLVFGIKNLEYDKETKTLHSPRLNYFEGISRHDIIIKGISKTLTFKYSNYSHRIVKDSITGNDIKIMKLVWESDETDVKFVISWYKHNNRTIVVKP